MSVNNDFYNDIGDALETSHVPHPHRYLYAQRYLKEDARTPFDPLLPLFDKFFGPNVLTLLVISKPYELADDTIPVFVERVKSLFNLWTTYKVYIWIDMVLADRVTEEMPSSNYSRDMDLMAGKIELMCEELEDYGFTYKGKLTEGKDAAYFQTFIDEFWAEPPV